MGFDFANAQLPALTPLANSFTVDDIENDLRNLVLDLFETYLAPQAFDINVLGAAHLGSLELVRRMVNADGLVLLPGDREEPSTRYVYRAWKSRNLQGRGCAFLKTYLQSLYPGAWDVEQQMQETGEAYPTALHDRSVSGNDADKYLTSRLKIRLDATASGDIAYLPKIIGAIVPARFVPEVTAIVYSSTSEATMIFACLGEPSILLEVHGDILPP